MEIQFSPPFLLHLAPMTGQSDRGPGGNRHRPVDDPATNITAMRPGSLGGACGGFLYQARAVAQERTAQITKQADSPAGLRRKNKMPYAQTSPRHPRKGWVGSVADRERSR